MNLKNLIILYLRNNNIVTIPLSILHIERLKDVDFHDNPIENLSPIVKRFLNKRYNIKTVCTAYRNSQNIHTSSIQESVKDSIVRILSVKDLE